MEQTQSIFLVLMGCNTCRAALETQLAAEIAAKQQAESSLGTLQASFKYEHELRLDLESVRDGHVLFCDDLC